MYAVIYISEDDLRAGRAMDVYAVSHQPRRFADPLAAAKAAWNHETISDAMRSVVSNYLLSRGVMPSRYLLAPGPLMSAVYERGCLRDVRDPSHLWIVLDLHAQEPLIAPAGLLATP